MYLQVRSGGFVGNGEIKANGAIGGANSGPNEWGSGETLVCERSCIDCATIVVLEAPVSRYSAFIKSFK